MPLISLMMGFLRYLLLMPIGPSFIAMPTCSGMFVTTDVCVADYCTVMTQSVLYMLFLSLRGCSLLQ